MSSTAIISEVRIVAPNTVAVGETVTPTVEIECSEAGSDPLNCIVSHQESKFQFDICRYSEVVNINDSVSIEGQPIENPEPGARTLKVRVLANGVEHTATQTYSVLGGSSGPSGQSSM